LVNEGKDRIKGSILGLILTLSAVIILKTINPAIVDVNTSPLSMTDGVYYTNGPEFKSANRSGNVSDIENGYETLYYKCESGNPVIVWLFENENGDYSKKTETKIINCGDDVSLKNYGSFKWAYEKTGIYYCLGKCDGNMCSGYMSEVVQKSQNEIALPFRGKAGSVRIVNNSKNSEYYGIIFHKNPGLTNGGECIDPIMPLEDNSCYNIDIPIFSADIFVRNRVEPDSSGNGITFYNETYGWNSDVNSGEIGVTKENIKNTNGYLKYDSIKLKYDYSNINSINAQYCNPNYPSCSGEYNQNSTEYQNVLAGQCCPCSTTQDCLGSINIKGDYLVGLYSYIKDSQGNKTEKKYCQTFTEEVENLAKHKYVEPGNLLEYIYIIATK